MIVLDLDGELTLDDLPEDAGVRPPGLSVASSTAPAGPDHWVGKPIEEIERYYMEKTLELTNGNREEASRLLGIGERTLYRKLQEWKKKFDE
jgi:two-component system response regulator HydG